MTHEITTPTYVNTTVLRFDAGNVVAKIIDNSSLDVRLELIDEHGVLSGERVYWGRKKDAKPRAVVYGAQNLRFLAAEINRVLGSLVVKDQC